MLELIPSAAVQRMKNIIDLMYKTSVDIFESKKAALALGDEAVMKQVGEGKDIISVLCALAILSAHASRLMTIPW